MAVSQIDICFLIKVLDRRQNPATVPPTSGLEQGELCSSVIKQELEANDRVACLLCLGCQQLEITQQRCKELLGSGVQVLDMRKS